MGYVVYYAYMKGEEKSGKRRWFFVYEGGQIPIATSQIKKDVLCRRSWSQPSSLLSRDYNLMWNLKLRIQSQLSLGQVNGR